MKGGSYRANFPQFTDNQGRVKVQFYWDRESTKDDHSSCWIRVASPWAGQDWGMLAIPRVGQEVIVSFQEGDADQPIIKFSRDLYNEYPTSIKKPPAEGELIGSKVSGKSIFWVIKR